MTIRTFGDFPPLKYFSLRQKRISVQTICWILKSIYADRMKPTDSLVHSRLKECFNIQVRKEWKVFVNRLAVSRKLQTAINKFSSVYGYIEVENNPEDSVIIKLRD